jgi:hypothetical protein
MAAFTEIDQRASDLDWFGVDRNGHIGHFATGGYVMLPASIASNKDDWQLVFDYFIHKLLPRGAWSPDPGVATRVQLGTDKQREDFFRSFAAMAVRGLYSYDLLDLHPKPSPYVRIAIPARPLIVDELPGTIRSIVLRTALDIDLALESAALIQATQTS